MILNSNFKMPKDFWDYKYINVGQSDYFPRVTVVFVR